MKRSAAKAAKQLKKELKSQFPDISFSVRSKSYSGGSSITVKWTGGPSKAEVQKIAKHWEAGSFNGMIDLYEYDPEKRDRPTAKYVFCNRSEPQF